MPHTSRKNRQKPAKRKESVDINGWTHVLRGPKLPSTELPDRNPDLTSLIRSKKKASSHQSFDQERFLTRYNAVKERWRTSSAAKVMEELFQEKIFSRHDIVITEAMCVGLGSFSDGDISGTMHASIRQLVAFEQWVELLKSKYRISAVYVQDPAFSTSDTSFLRTRLSFEVVHHPAAHALLGNTTFLFAPYSPSYFLVPLLCVARPALYIANNVHEALGMSVTQRRLRWALRQPKLKDFFTSRTSRRLPVDDRLEWMQGLRAYWQRMEGEERDSEVVWFYGENERQEDLKELDGSESEEGMRKEEQDDGVHEEGQDASTPVLENAVDEAGKREKSEAESENTPKDTEKGADTKQAKEKP